MDKIHSFSINNRKTLRRKYVTRAISQNYIHPNNHAVQDMVVVDCAYCQELIIILAEQINAHDDI